MPCNPLRDRRAVTPPGLSRSSTPAASREAAAAPRSSMRPLGMSRLPTVIASAISGSRAALRMVVVPLASTAASRRFSVAPTEGIGSRMSAPRKPCGAVAWIVPPSSSTMALMARSPAIWKSMPRKPIASPPGSGRRASPQRASRAPSRSTEARMRVTRSGSMLRGSTRSAEMVSERPAEVVDQFISQPALAEATPAPRRRASPARCAR